MELLKETFEDPDFDREAHFADVFQHEPGGIPTAISIWFDAVTAPYIRERRWHPSQQIEEYEDSSLTLNFVARGLQEVKRWVLYYGKGAVIKSPPELVEMIKKDISAMHDHYFSVNSKQKFDPASTKGARLALIIPLDGTNGGNAHFPKGKQLSDLSVLRFMDFTSEIIDKYFKQLTTFTPRSFQREAISNLLNQPKPINTILKAPTGSGKTETAISSLSTRTKRRSPQVT